MNRAHSIAEREDEFHAAVFDSSLRFKRIIRFIASCRSKKKVREVLKSDLFLSN